MQNEIFQTWFFKQSPGEVWEYLTKPELIELWLGKTDFLPIVGHKFRFMSPYGNDCFCEVLEVDPFTKLSYTWQKNSSKDDKPFHSKVTWTLIAKNEGTELQLQHNGFTFLEDKIAHSNGWNACMNKMTLFINAKKNYRTARYSVTIEVPKSAHDVFTHLTNDVSKFWPEDFKGNSSQLYDEFVFTTGDDHYSKNKVTEFVPDKKLVWLVTESIRKTDNFEWTGTKMIFELSPNGNNTMIKFTYDGLVLENEYDRLVQICDMVIKEKLYNSLTHGGSK